MEPAKLNYENFVYQLPFLIFLIDKNSNMINFNQLVIDSYKFNNASEFVGKSHFELPWKKYADEFIEQDKVALKGNTQFYLNTSIRADGSKIMLMHKKTPFIHQNSIKYTV